MEHAAQCETKGIQLSVDGVSESKSTSISLDVYSLKFNGCKDIYPIRIVRPINKYPIDNQRQLHLVLNDVLQNGLKIHRFIADNPKRSFLRFSMQHSAKCGCEYCFESGVSFRNTSSEESDALVQKIDQQRNDIIEQINILRDEDASDEHIESLEKVEKNLTDAKKMLKKKKTSHIVWPANTRNGELRTKDKVLQIVEQIEAQEEEGEMLASEKKGIKGRSLLLDIDHFDYIKGMPTEYMHVVALGGVKRLLEVTFSVGENRQRNIKTPLSSPDTFNELMKDVKVFKESSRRIRKLDMSVMIRYEGSRTEERYPLLLSSHM